MQRICPLLAFEGDHRSVRSEPDRRHRCHAADVPLPLALREQARLCLTEAHERCERLLAYRREHTRPSRVPPPAPDATFVSTRLIGLPERAPEMPIARGEARSGTGRLAAGGLLAAVGLGAIAMLSGGLPRLALPVVAPLTPSPTATPSPTPVPTPEPTPSATATPTPTPTATPTPSPTPVPTPTPGRLYVVQSGDTLSEIAARFGTTVSAISAANGLEDADRIYVGQELIIP